MQIREPAAAKRFEEESRTLRLVKQYHRTKNAEAREALVSQFRPLVEKLSRRFLPSGVPVEDLVQEGYLGLLHAIDHFDPRKKVKFITYATHCIAGQLRHYLRDRGQIIKEPAWLQELSQRVRRVSDSLAQQLGRQPSSDELAAAVSLPEETVLELEATRALFSVSSLEDAFQDGSRTLAEREGVSESGLSHGEGSIEHSFEIGVEQRVVLEGALTRLKDLERRVVYMFYYADNSQTEIARDLGISNNYVSHILKNSARKLQQVYRSEAVRDAALQYEAQRSRVFQDGQDEIAPRSVIDPVTGLYSREYFDARLDEEVSRAARHQLEISVMRIQIGNELYDAALFALVAQTIKGCVRRSDIVARTDQHEIAALLPYTGATRQTVEERLEMRLAELQQKSSRSFTFNVGCASFPGHRKKDALFAAASPL